jgi:hypothetical protein
MALLEPIVKERLRNLEQPKDERSAPPVCYRDFTSHSSQPNFTVKNDVISWLIDVSDKEHRNLRSICLRILVLNFASLHTSAQVCRNVASSMVTDFLLVSKGFSHALLYLAANPQYCEPLREEVSEVINQDGWTKDAMTKLPKMDSFLKESLRLSGMSLCESLLIISIDLIS